MIKKKKIIHTLRRHFPFLLFLLEQVQDITGKKQRVLTELLQPRPPTGLKTYLMISSVLHVSEKMPQLQESCWQQIAISLWLCQARQLQGVNENEAPLRNCSQTRTRNLYTYMSISYSHLALGEKPVPRSRLQEKRDGIHMSLLLDSGGFH